MRSYHIFGFNYKINDFYSIDDKNAYWNGNKIEGADLDSFRILHQFWAIDKNNIYWASCREESIDRETFEPLNYFMAKDKFNIWNCSEKIIGMDAEPFNFWKYLEKIVGIDKGPFNIANCGTGTIEIDLESFSLCEDKDKILRSGFCKDKNNVFYYHDSRSEIKILKNASPKTFVSLHDGHFGFDEKNVFCGTEKLNKADPKTFEIIEPNRDKERIDCARDKNHYYHKYKIATKDYFEELTK
jgi:hypothetical protein